MAAASAGLQVPGKVQELLQLVDRQQPMQLKSVPMIYAREADIPLPEVAQALLQHPEELVGPHTWRAAQQRGPDSQAWLEQHIRVLQALVAVAFGALDLAHNLVTPLCWGAPTEYGGPPVRNSPAAQDASYVHALVHRWEGEHDGEFGSGFSNASYWYRAAGPHPVLQALQPMATKLAGGDPALLKFVAASSPSAGTLDPTRLVTLCSEALRTRDAKLVGFANQVVHAEWRTLFLMTLKRTQQLGAPS